MIYNSCHHFIKLLCTTWKCKVTDLESFLQDLLCFGTTDSAMDSNLFISADTEGAHSVAGCKIGKSQMLTD